MDFDPTTLARADMYKLMIGGIVPRPIAWVSTVSAEGRANLAPFSFFNGVTASPPTLLFCPSNKEDGSEKDTLRNAAMRDEGGTGEFVVNVVSMAMIREMSATAEALAYGQSEWELAGLAGEASVKVQPRRVKGAPIAYECVTERVLRLSPGTPGGGNIVIGRIVSVHAAQGVVNERYHVDAAKLDAVGRMGGSIAYATTRERLEVPRGREALKKC